MVGKGLFQNGAPTPLIQQLVGVLLPKQTFVIAHPNADAAILSVADQTANKLNFNGDDPVQLVKVLNPISINIDSIEGIGGNPHAIFDTLDLDTIDQVGIPGVWPGNQGYQVGSGTTKNSTLIRKPGVTSGKEDWACGQKQWIVNGADDSEGLGSHKCVCSLSCPSNKPTARFVSAQTSVSEGVGFVNIFFNVDAPMPETGYFIVCDCDPPDMATCGQAEDYTIESAFSLPSAPQNFDGCPQEGGTTEGICVGWAERLPEGWSGNEFFTVYINDDNIVENEETICFVLKKNKCIKIDKNNKQHIILIQDNDTPPTFISEKESGNHGIKIYSNVNSGELNIKFTGQYSGNAEIQIQSILGQVIKNYRISGFQEKSSFTFDISALKAGTYLLKVTQNNYSFFEKFIKL